MNVRSKFHLNCPIHYPSPITRPIQSQHSPSLEYLPGEIKFSVITNVAGSQCTAHDGGAENSQSKEQLSRAPINSRPTVG